MQAYVSKAAWLWSSEWILEGLEIWHAMRKGAGISSRDYFLAKPTKDLDGIAARMASYIGTHRRRAKRSSRRSPPGAVPLLERGVGTCLTEHSERVTMRTWAQCSGVPPDVCKMLGRWSPTVDEGYMRAHRSTVTRAQEHIAHFVKSNMAGVDPFDERETIEKMGVRMLQLGHSEDEVREQLRRLRVFDESAYSEIRQFKWTMIDAEPEEKGARGSTEPEFPDFFPEVVPVGLPDSESELEEVNGELVPSGFYVISKVGKASRRTLHKMGECYRVPGVHYADFEVIGSDPPEPERYHQVCKACFQGRGSAAAPLRRRKLVEGSESEGSVSSSDFEDVGE